LNHSPDVDNKRTLIVAHRGASTDAPENTLAAFDEAWRQGADAIETDLRVTRDGVVVCSHDASTARCGDRELDIARSTYEQLLTVDVGSWQDDRFAGQRIPTLEQVLATVPDGKCVFLEIKDRAVCLNAVRAAMNATGINSGQVVIIAFDADVVPTARRIMPDGRANWLTAFQEDGDSAYRPSVRAILETLKSVGATGLGCQADKRIVNPAFVRRLADAGYSTHVWTVDKPHDARHFLSVGIESLTTNAPRMAIEQRDRKGTDD
jgi:glycerophosphoryl diester phosphodiesterase